MVCENCVGVLTSAASLFSDVVDKTACKPQSLCPNGKGRNNGPVIDGPAGDNVYYGVTTKKDRVCVDCSIACPDCVPSYKANEMYSDENSPALCTAHTKCGVGERRAIAGTKLNDATCVPCSAETFNTVAEQNTCAPCKSPCKAVATCAVKTGGANANCAAASASSADCTAASTAGGTTGAGNACEFTAVTEKEATSCTPATDRVCEALNACIGVQWSATGVVPCDKTHGTCAVGKGMTVAGTATADIQCGDCAGGGVSFSDIDNRFACKACKKCIVGNGLDVACTASTDTMCKACDAATTYSDKLSYDACTDKSLCPIGSVRREEKRGERNIMCVCACMLCVCAVCSAVVCFCVLCDTAY